jgi:hypothetical protein
MLAKPKTAALNDCDLVIALFCSIAIELVSFRGMIVSHKRQAGRLVYDLRTHWSYTHRKRLGKPIQGVNAGDSPRVL